jgi:ABC-type transport system involved in multi-copper enzyme maturation permease subunit
VIRPAEVWAIARSELRLTRRLARYWVFVSIAALAAILNYVNFYFVHYFFSPYSASAAAANPRFFMSQFGVNFVLLFLLGVVFLGFDLRARDRRERIVEVLDALPITNLELVAGRAIGLLLASWIPMLVLIGLVSIVAAILGNPLEPYSTIAAALFMAVPGFTCSIGLVYLLTVVLRHRLAAAVVSLAVIIGSFFVSLWWIPVWATPFIDVTGGYAVPFPTDLAPQMITLPGLLQRLGFTLAGAGFLMLTAAFHPRRDDSRRSTLTLAALATIVVAAGLVGSMARDNYRPIQLGRAWLAAHEARRDEPVPDIVSVAGSVKLDPPRSVAIDLDLRFRAPADEGLDRALFTLNPGLVVQSVTDASGSALQFDHKDGMLDVVLSGRLEPGASSSIALVAAGLPDDRFSYLDAAINPLELPAAKAQIVVLGYEPMVFRKKHVSLLPGLRFLPASGTEAGRGDPRRRAPDFHEVDLEVEVPEGWLVAGPGRRQEPQTHAAAGSERFRFAPHGFVPEVALVAGPFESRSVEIDGVLLELLLHKGHLANLEFFADAAPEIERWLTERLDEVRRVGLDYPYDALTLVEVPMILRGFGGGWRQDSTLIQPALVLMRESGFPTARFSAAEERFERERDSEGGVPRAKREGLERFFENDINGGNPFIAAARSFFGFQTAGSGAAGVPLDWVCETLSSQVLAERTGYFSVHFFDQDFGNDFQRAAMAMDNEDRIGDTYSQVLIHMLTSKPEIWDQALGVSLGDLDPTADPKLAVDVLNLKAGAMARSLLDALGRERAGRFLAALRQRTAGGTFSRADVIAAGSAVGEELESWLAVWIDETLLPGFTVGSIDYQRIPDAADGSMRYQTTVVVRNEEEPPGLLRLEYRTERETEDDNVQPWERSEPVLFAGKSAVAIGLTTSAPLRSLRVAPYLALNRDPFSVQLPTLDAEAIVQAEAFSGSRPVEWTEPLVEAIVVDDLDSGFALDESGGQGMLRVAGRGDAEEQLDQGLPVSQGMRPSRWSRMSMPQAFGKYRRTMAVVRAGDGKRNAVFSTELPRAGTWQLEYHMPSRPSDARTRRHPGTWALTLSDVGGEDRDLTFDAEQAEAGWNAVGTFHVERGEVQVKVSDRTDGDYVVADAIRWVAVAESASRSAS